MHYFFFKNSTVINKKTKHHILFSLSSTNKINTDIIDKISRILDAKYTKNLFSVNYKYSAIASRSGTNSPWSSKTKDILDSCLGFSDYEIEKLDLYIRSKDSPPYSPLYDQMTEIYLPSSNLIRKYLNNTFLPKKNYFRKISTKNIETANNKMGLAMNPSEIKYLENVYLKLKRDPTDVELMMFSQINSEHCRHKIFNSTFYIDGKKKNKTLFSMIKSTYKSNKDVISAYKDNSSIIKGKKINELVINKQFKYKTIKSPENYIIKAETHNHPTAISPYAGAATGSGGEIRDEGATGRGSSPKVGFCGYTLSNLSIPHHEKQWEKNSIGYPGRIKSSHEIIIEAPIGAARYNNEFGRPNIFGYFRTYEDQNENCIKNQVNGYHKPIMIAGGIGYINQKYTRKKKLSQGDVIVILGGPSFRIGIGGGAASSMQSGSSTEQLDYASVQRDNAEIERRCQEVINKCTYLQTNPIISIHDIGAGGLCNAVPEIVNDFDMGAVVDMDKVHTAEKNMSSLEIWCNESQERYVLIIKDSNYHDFKKICERENCPEYLIGHVTTKKSLKVSHGGNLAIDLPMKYLLGKPPLDKIKVSTPSKDNNIGNYKYPALRSCIKNVLQLPSVSDKGFLITIGDRSVTGLVARDQLIGPNQIPVSNFSITKSDINSSSGQVLTMGERPSIATTSSIDSIDMSFGEIITNLASVQIKQLDKIKLSANWMANSSDKTELHNLYQSVDRLSSLCQKCNIIIPVGKDSLSMSTKWKDTVNKEVKSPVSLILSAFSSIDDVNDYVTPQSEVNSDLYLIDLGHGKNRMGGSALNQTLNITKHETPNIHDINDLINYFYLTQSLLSKKILNAYHDRSDGGLVTCLIEMAFASNMSVITDNFEINNSEIIKVLFNEELGGVFAISKQNQKTFLSLVDKYNLTQCLHKIGNLKKDSNPKLSIQSMNYNESLSTLRKYWSELSYLIQSQRDNKKTALSEYKAKIQSHKHVNTTDTTRLTFSINLKPKRYLSTKKKPKIAIFREQGVNGHKEMANAFMLAGFECFDVTTNDIINHPDILNQYNGLVACGGFSYGDVLGAGRGWANKIIYNRKAYDALSLFFNNKNKFSLGVCNGCQMLSHLKSIIPGANHWPEFISNNSNQFEARQVLVKIPKSNSIFFKDMHNSTLPIIVSHGEGRISVKNKKDIKKTTLRFVNPSGQYTEEYPFNPNGSTDGATGFCNNDGRINIMMPHPERLACIDNFSWAPKKWKNSPWMKMFYNAREWIGNV